MNARILVTGGCGFVGQTLLTALTDGWPDLSLMAFDNLQRPGSEENRRRMAHRGIRFVHGDVRCPSDLDSLPEVDWVIEAAANPSVLGGTSGGVASRQLVEHNLVGTLNVLEHCRRQAAGFVLLSTSRVYSIPPLARLPVRVQDDAYVPCPKDPWPFGLSPLGISEDFSTAAPVSLYGATKLASEVMSLEYGALYGFPVWVNRCGVMAGAGQFGRPDQGIFSYWLNSYARRRPLRYVGFDGHGHQVRDCLHPRDLAALLMRQFQAAGTPRPQVINVGGGTASAMSLRQLSAWCADRWGSHPVTEDRQPRPFDLPWVVLDTRQAESVWGWHPATRLEEILEEIARHADQHPDWLEVSAG